MYKTNSHPDIRKEDLEPGVPVTLAGKGTPSNVQNELPPGHQDGGRRTEDLGPGVPVILAGKGAPSNVQNELPWLDARCPMSSGRGCRKDAAGTQVVSSG
jgi:hypothetical protein